MSEDAVAVVVTSAARVVRRQVGPQAWVVLEELVARAGHDRQCNYADASLAELVESLELSSDVIRSALRRLIDARLVERREQRAPGTRRFATTRYVIIGRTGLTVVSGAGVAEAAKPDAEKPDAEKPDAARPTQPERHGNHPDRAEPQLSLLDLAPGLATRARRRRHA